MPFPIILAMAVLAVLGVAPAAQAQQTQPSVFDIRPMVIAVAFDPTTYFPSIHAGDRSVVRIVYTGDDYGWPVYAIAVAEGCVDQEDRNSDACATRLRARMVRSPAPADIQRPRQRGLHLLGLLVETGATDPASIRATLSDVGTEWLEADLRTCPGAVDALRRLTEAGWPPPPLIDQTVEAYVSGLVMHADFVRVEVQHFARRTTYHGWIADGSPAAWAVAFAGGLEPCWRPASGPAPWKPA
jgi:hypothetical protein